jgi:hypothetical protein
MTSIDLWHQTFAIDKLLHVAVGEAVPLFRFLFHCSPRVNESQTARTVGVLGDCE